MTTDQNKQASTVKKLLDKLLYTALKQAQTRPKATCGTIVGMLNYSNTAVYCTVPALIESFLAAGSAELRVALEVNVAVPNTDLSCLPMTVKVVYTLNDIVEDNLDAKALAAAKAALADSFAPKVLNNMYARNVELIIV